MVTVDCAAGRDTEGRRTVVGMGSGRYKFTSLHFVELINDLTPWGSLWIEIVVTSRQRCGVDVFRFFQMRWKASTSVA